MITKMFAVFDSKAAVYGTPFFMANERMAIRAFTDLVNDNQSLVSKHPEDFSLFHLGEFDDLVGSFDSIKPLNLVTASALVRPTFIRPDFSPIKNGDVVKEVVR